MPGHTRQSFVPVALESLLSFRDLFIEPRCSCNVHEQVSIDFKLKVSMRICGVDLTGNDAVICLLVKGNGDFNLPDCRVRKLTLKKEHTGEDLRQFQIDFATLMSEYDVDKVVIRERMPRGKFAGGAISFKLEAALQLIQDLDVNLLPPSQINSTLADNPLSIKISDTELKAFQEAAFKTAYAACVSH